MTQAALEVIDLESARKARLDHGFTRVANDLIMHLAHTNLSSRETKFVFAVMSKTYRYQKDMDWISGSQLVDMTGMSKSHVSETKRTLLDRQILVADGKQMGLNPFLDQWLDKFPKSGTKKVPGTRNSSSRNQEPKFPVSGTKVPEIGAHNKNITITQETITKDKPKRAMKPKAFKDMFALYPAHRKGGTDATAWKAWKSEKLTDQDALNAITWLEQAAQNDPTSWSVNANGYAYGVTKFIRERIWLTPVPTGRNNVNNNCTSWAANLEEVL